MDEQSTNKAVFPRNALFLRARKAAREAAALKGPWHDKTGVCPVGVWHIVRGRPREVLCALGDLRAAGLAPPVDMLCPVERVEVRDQRPGRGRGKRVVDVPYFGPYFFLRAGCLAGDGALYESLLAIRGFDDFVQRCPRGWPAPMRDQTFPQAFLAPVIVETEPWIKAGDVGRVLSGPFMGMAGEVRRVMGALDAGARIELFLSILGGSVPVNLDAGQIERLACAG